MRAQDSRAAPRLPPQAAARRARPLPAARAPLFPRLRARRSALPAASHRRARARRLGARASHARFARRRHRASARPAPWRRRDAAPLRAVAQRCVSASAVGDLAGALMARARRIQLREFGRQPSRARVRGAASASVSSLHGRFAAAASSSRCAGSSELRAPAFRFETGERCCRVLFQRRVRAPDPVRLARCAGAGAAPLRGRGLLPHRALSRSMRQPVQGRAVAASASRKRRQGGGGVRLARSRPGRRRRCARSPSCRRRASASAARCASVSACRQRR